MIKERMQVEMVIYESDELKRFYDYCNQNNKRGIYQGLLEEIATDIQWQQGDDFVSWDDVATFNVIARERSAEELIELIDEAIKDYDIQDYYGSDEEDEV